MNIIELAKKTTINLLNAASTSRHTTPEAVANEMNTILEGDERVTADVIKAFVKSGLMNTKGVFELKLTKGRYGGIREVDLGNKVVSSQPKTETTDEIKAETKSEVEAPAKKRTKKQLRAWRKVNIAKARDARMAKLAAKRAEVQPSV